MSVFFATHYEVDPCAAYHDYRKHGTCAYGNDYQQYLDDIRQAYNALAWTEGFQFLTRQTYLHEAPFQVTVDPNELASMFGDDTVLHCDSNCNLKAVRACFEPDSNTGHWSSSRTSCPAEASVTDGDNDGDTTAMTWGSCTQRCGNEINITSLDECVQSDQRQHQTQDRRTLRRELAQTPGDDSSDNESNPELEVDENPDDASAAAALNSVLYPPNQDGTAQLFGAPMGSHDLFLLEVHWMPELVNQNNEYSSYESYFHQDSNLLLNWEYAQRHLTTHGLWPMYRNPRSCSDVMTTQYGG